MIEAGPLLLLFGLLWALWAIGWIFNESMVRYRKRKERRFKEAEKLYLETGEITHPLRSAGYGALKAAEKERKRFIRKRLRDGLEFSAVCTCPSCGIVEFHEFDSILAKTVKRRCIKCDFTWRQM